MLRLTQSDVDVTNRHPGSGIVVFAVFEVHLVLAITGVQPDVYARRILWVYLGQDR